MKARVTVPSTRGRDVRFDWIWPHQIPCPRKLKKAIKAQMLGLPRTRRQRLMAMRYFGRMARRFAEVQDALTALAARARKSQP